MMLSFFFFKQKTAYEMRISDWSSDVCSSDLVARDGIRNGDGLRKDRLPHVLPVARERHLDVADPARGGELQIDCLLGFEVRVEAVEVKIGRASCRESVCQYVYIAVVAASLKKKKHYQFTKATSNVRTDHTRPAKT